MMRRVVSVVAIALALSMLPNCLDATAIALDISTSSDCSVVQTNAVEIAAGTPGNDSSEVTASTMQCSGGTVGTIVLLPSGAGDQVGIRVMLGVTVPTDDCAPPMFDGCIVARRIVSYVSHTTVTVPIDLDPACVGNACSPLQTCLAGSCVDAGVMCTDSVCQ